MALAEMRTHGLGFGYRVLGSDAQFTPPNATVSTTVRVIFSQDGVLVSDGMAQSIGPSVRVRASEFSSGVPRAAGFVIDGVAWKAREAGLPIHDGKELSVQLAKA